MDDRSPCDAPNRFVGDLRYNISSDGIESIEDLMVDCIHYNLFSNSLIFESLSKFAAPLGTMNSAIAIIMGVGPGLGASLAKRFAKEGYQVAMLARSGDYLNKLSSEISASGGKVPKFGLNDRSGNWISL